MTSAWYDLYERCKKLHAKYGGDIPIPTLKGENLEQLFLDTHVEKSVWRFVVFILWLKQQPFPFGWYTVIKRDHLELIGKCLCRLTRL